METKSSTFWWLKTPSKETPAEVPKLDLRSSASVSELLDKSTSKHDSDVDIDSILEEISRIAAQSPLGPYERSMEERSIDEIIKEAEKIYLESSKSFEQLSQRSKTSHNITDLLTSNSNNSTPTPKSISPLPKDPEGNLSEYSEDFSQDSKDESHTSGNQKENVEILEDPFENDSDSEKEVLQEPVKTTAETVAPKNVKIPSQSNMQHIEKQNLVIPPEMNLKQSVMVADDNANVPTERIIIQEDTEKVNKLNEEIQFRNGVIKTLEEDNKMLKDNVAAMKTELENTRAQLEKYKSELNAKTLSSPEINLELEKALEELKDSKEINTALQLQLDTINKTHHLLKSSYDDLVNTNKNLERKVVELDTSLARYKTELLNVQQTKDKLLENEINLNKLLEIEKLQAKSLKLQNEKDAKCIQDLNRQIKEMERIIARKHPDSVSALIVAAKEDATDSNLTARRVLEDRIKALEQEVLNRDTHSSKVFLEIQDKFNQMKNKYESHIDDLELHVSDLKSQLKKKSDTYDVYTQTILEQKIPEKETHSTSVQTDVVISKPRPTTVKKPDKEIKDDAHLLATIRGLQTDLSNKEKVIVKLQKDIDDIKKTNRRLQKEREGSLRNLSDRKEFRSYPEKLSAQSGSSTHISDHRKEEQLQQVKMERDRLKHQLQRLEEDYQALKKKRLDDLTALQEAHEQETSNYVASITPLREQMELQQVQLTALQSQLTTAREQLAIATVERDHLDERLRSGCTQCHAGGERCNMEVEALLKKISTMKKEYEEREYRLRAILHSLAQKTVTNRSCEQCADRQQQLIAYKGELDQLLATVRALH